MENSMYQANKDRYSKMEYSPSGKSGLKLPRVALGLWHNFGNLNDYETMKELVFTAFDNGITYFDLANNYGPEPGRAEINFGKILKDGLMPYRDEIIISTKAGYTMWDGPYGDWGSRKYLMASLDQSLNRLGIPYVDIFYHHRMDPNTPLEETMLALRDIVLQGKALYTGLSNYDGSTLEKAEKLLKEYNVPFIVNQNRYNIFDRTIEKNGLKETSIKLSKGIVAFSPLAQGLLTDRYLNGIPSDSRVSRDPRFLNESKITPEIVEKISELNQIAIERNEKLADMALKWVLRDDSITSCIIGASKKEQIIINSKVIESPAFSDDQLKRIDEIIE